MRRLVVLLALAASVLLGCGARDDSEPQSADEAVAGSVRTLQVPTATVVPEEALVRAAGAPVGELVGASDSEAGSTEISYRIDPEYIAPTAKLSPTLYVGKDPVIQLLPGNPPPVAEHTGAKEIFDAVSP